MQINRILVATFLIHCLSFELTFAQTGCKAISAHCFNGNARNVLSASNNGTVHGATLTTDRKGQANAAYLFDGIDDQITLPPANYLLDEVTYTVWVYVDALPPATSGNSAAMSILNTGAFGGDLHILLNNNTQFGFHGFSAGCYNQDGTNHRAITGVLPQTKQWYHLALTRTNTQVSLYVDGLLVQTTPFSNSSVDYETPVQLSIGARHGSLQFFNGKIDDLRIYDCAKSASEILSIYQYHSCGESVGSSEVVDPYKTQTQVKLFPNPTADRAWINLNQAMQGVGYILYNTQGQIIHEESLGQVDEFEIELPDYSGTFIVRVRSGENTLGHYRLFKK